MKTTNIVSAKKFMLFVFLASIIATACSKNDFSVELEPVQPYYNTKHFYVSAMAQSGIHLSQKEQKDGLEFGVAFDGNANIESLKISRLIMSIADMGITVAKTPNQYAQITENSPQSEYKYSASCDLSNLVFVADIIEAYNATHTEPLSAEAFFRKLKGSEKISVAVEYEYTFTDYGTDTDTIEFSYIPKAK